MLPEMISQTVSNPIVSALSIASIFEMRYEDNLLSPIVISHLLFFFFQIKVTLVCFKGVLGMVLVSF